MKTISIKEIKTELNHSSNNELIELCLRLSKFKKENKELISYLLFESSNEEEFVNRIKLEMDEQFKAINTTTFYFIKKSIRKIARFVKTNIRYSKNKETEVELLLYFCKKLTTIKPSIKNNTVLKNLYNRELDAVIKKLNALHEDLQYDYLLEINSLNF